MCSARAGERAGTHARCCGKGIGRYAVSEASLAACARCRSSLARQLDLLQPRALEGSRRVRCGDDRFIMTAAPSCLFYWNTQAGGQRCGAQSNAARATRCGWSTGACARDTVEPRPVHYRRILMTRLAACCDASAGWPAGRSACGQSRLLRTHHRRFDGGVLESGCLGPSPGQSVHVRGFTARDPGHG